MEYTFAAVDFNKPSFLFKFEDVLKEPLGGLFYKSFVEFMKLRGDEQVLDFGCGGGALSRYLAEHLVDNGSVTCLDTSEYWIGRAKKRLSPYRNVICLQGDIRNTTFQDHPFDIISIVHVIHDIAPGSRAATVQSLARTLKNDGRLFIWEPTRPSHGISILEVRQLMNHAGLKQVRAILKRSAYIGQFEKIK